MIYQNIFQKVVCAAQSWIIMDLGEGCGGFKGFLRQLQVITDPPVRRLFLLPSL